jgi:hypothetical protein
MDGRQAMVNKFKKPRSRKIYVEMDQDITSFFYWTTKKTLPSKPKPPLKRLPEIIQKYDDNEKFIDKLKIIKDLLQTNNFHGWRNN